MASTSFARPAVTAAFLVAIALVYFLARGDGAVARTWSEELGFRLYESAAEAGLDFEHQAPTLDPDLRNIEPHIAGLGASVSVTDVNGDGWADLYLTNSAIGSSNALFLNQGDGTFRDVAAGAGLGDVNEEGEGVSMGAVWGDFDNDGHEDVFVYKYGYPRLFRNRGDGTFEDVTEAAGLRRWTNSNGAIWLDYDRDGLLDLYVTAYFRDEVDLWNVDDTRIMHESFEFARNGGMNRLYRNLGDGRFEDVTEATGVGSTRWTMAAASADFDGDGWPDLYLANDYGPEEFYRNEEGRRFVLTDAGLADDSKSGMSVSLGDVHNRGRLDIFVTNISERGYLFQGNNLRINFLAESGRFDEVARGVVADAGWAWGAQFGDLNNDGQLDLFVTNGFISADPDQDYWYGMSKIAGGHGALFQDARNWPEIGEASLSGYERSRVLLRQGGELVDVAEAVGVTDTRDGRAVAYADLENRGALDVIVANQEGPVLLYRNAVDPANHWIQVRLVGTRSNRSAIGAEVVVEWDGQAQMQVVSGGSGFSSQNQRRLHFGLGAADAVDRIRIRWPSGGEQVLERPEADRLHVVREDAG